MAVKRLLNVRPAFYDSNGDPYSGARLFFYAAGSSTKQNTYTTSAGSVANSNPITLNSRGEPGTEIWGTVGQTYKIGLAIPGSDDPPASFIWTEDNVSPINDSSISLDQWVSGPSPTYVSATSFTLVGDQTSTFDVGRRLKFTTSGGTVYGTIVTSAYTVLTTITISGGDGPLDSGLSAVYYSLLSATNPAAPIPAIQAFYAIGISCANNSGTPNTQYDLNATAIVLRDTNNRTVVRWNPGSITNNVSTAGPAANGRDQAGAFSAGSWVHFYWIWNGATLATLSSATAPPTGPTLPTGYTHWAYAGAVRFDGSSQLIKTRILGSTAYYEAGQTIASGLTATVETSVSLASYIPPNAQNISITALGSISADGSGEINATLAFRVVSGSTYKSTNKRFTGLAAGNSVSAHDSTLTLPNISQNLYYLWTVTVGSSPSASIAALSYQLPNGGE